MFDFLKDQRGLETEGRKGGSLRFGQRSGHGTE